MTIVLKIGIFLLLASFTGYLKFDGFEGVFVIPFSIGFAMFVIEGLRLIIVSLGWL